MLLDFLLVLCLQAQRIGVGTRARVLEGLARVVEHGAIRGNAIISATADEVENAHTCVSDPAAIDSKKKMMESTGEPVCEIIVMESVC